MDPSTEIASGFTVAQYSGIRDRLDPEHPDTAEWKEIHTVFRRRIGERFLKPISLLARYDAVFLRKERRGLRLAPELARYENSDALPTRSGFAILALGCLLIDTIQAFREGRVSTGESSSARSFKTFLRARSFRAFSSADREHFYSYVRNALLHNGETREDWKVRIDSGSLLTKHPQAGTCVINRRLFHAGVLREFRSLCYEIKAGPVETRTKFLRRMDAICGLAPSPLNNLYFAYGSNLLESEIKRHAKDAEPHDIAFLPGYRLVFTKHSETRSGDAASIEPDSGSIVWGFVYKVHDCDRERLREREKGYAERSESVFLRSDGGDVTAVNVFTFVGEKVCATECGASHEYLSLIIDGAKSRQLPTDYISALEARLEQIGRG